MNDAKPSPPSGPDWRSHSVTSIGLLPTTFITVLSALIAGCAYLLIEKTPSAHASAFLGSALLLGCMGLGCSLLYLLTFGQITSILANLEEQTETASREALYQHLARSKRNSDRFHLGQLILLALAFFNAGVGVTISSQLPIWETLGIITVNIVIFWLCVISCGSLPGRVSRR